MTGYKPRMKARLRIAVVAAAGALLLGAAALFLGLHQSLLGAVLLNSAGKFLGDQVTADDVRISLHHLGVTGRIRRHRTASQCSKRRALTSSTACATCYLAESTVSA